MSAKRQYDTRTAFVAARRERQRRRYARLRKQRLGRQPAGIGTVYLSIPPPLAGTVAFAILYGDRAARR